MMDSLLTTKGSTSSWKPSWREFLNSLTNRMMSRPILPKGVGIYEILQQDGEIKWSWLVLVDSEEGFSTNHNIEMFKEEGVNKDQQDES